MRITLKDSVTGADIVLDARPEDYNGEQGWRILFPEKDSFVMVERDGEWHVMDDEDLNPEMVAAIGNAIRPHSRYNSITR